MYLQRLELQGFKSFANKTTIVFSESGEGGRRGMTAIVGPNGSGKSNVADAVRWVLGEQSNKALRGKKSEDVIFSGSDKRTKMGMAEVSLFLRNDSGFRIQDSGGDKDSIEMILNAPEIVITRRLYRDGTSEYLLNNAKVRLQDIHLLLAKANVGERSYAIIGQGMVDQFLFLSPEERKEAIDEAAGIRHLQIKKNDAERKLHATDENLHEAQLLLAEIEPRLRSLTRQVKRLSEREALEKELRALQATHYGTMYHALSNETTQLKKAVSQGEKAVADKEVDLQAIQRKLDTLEKAESSSTKLLEFQKELETLHSERQRLRDRAFEVRVAAERTKGRELPMAAVISSIESFRGEEQALLSKIRAAKTLEDLADIRTVAERMDTQLSLLLARVRGESKDKENQKNLSEIEKNIESTTLKITGVQQKISEASKSDVQQKSSFFALQREYQALLEVVTRLRSGLGEQRVALAKTEQRLEDLESEIKNEMQVKDVSKAMESSKGSAAPDESATNDINRLKQQLAMIGGIDPEVVKEHTTTNERYTTLKTQYDDLIGAKEKLTDLSKELDTMIEHAFNDAFRKINVEFGKFFAKLFGGGSAKLVLLEPEVIEEDEHADATEPAERSPAPYGAGRSDVPPRGMRTRAGVDIQAQPPGKRVKTITVLSGGERALTAIALISAIIAVNPSPFVVLDEVDAALDEANSIRFADIIYELTEKTQFIVITHNRYTMEKCGLIYGVTMNDDAVSKILSVKLEEAVVTSTK